VMIFWTEDIGKTLDPSCKWSEFCRQDRCRNCYKKNESVPQVVRVLSSGSKKMSPCRKWLEFCRQDRCHNSVEKNESEPQVVRVLSLGLIFMSRN